MPLNQEPKEIKEKETKNYESELLQNVIENPEGTMNQVASNSVGSVILDLKNHYFGKTPITEEVTVLIAGKACRLLYIDADNKAFLECTQEFVKLNVNDFFNSKESEDSESTKKVKKKLTRDLASTIPFIINKAAENVSDLDIVTLYDGETNQEISYAMPLKTVLPILWKALNDDVMFVQCHEGTPDEQLKQANADRYLRRYSFYQCLERAKAGICHQGIRNELILLLNGIHRDVKIIEDAGLLVPYFLKDQINQSFWKYYKNSFVDGSKKKEAYSTLLSWMINNDATVILKIIDPKNQILNDLDTYFIQHGSNPKTITVKYGGKNLPLAEFITIALQYLEFSYNPKEHSELLKIQYILNGDADVIDQPDRNKALSIIQNWTRKECQLEEKEQSQLSEFCAFYKAHNELIANRSLLVLCGFLQTKEIGDLVISCNNYFKEATKQNGFPSVSSADLKKINNFQQTLIKFKLEAMQPEIANFFFHWFDSIKQHDTDTQKRYYGMLLAPAIQNKMILSDTAITEFNQNKKNQVAEGNVNYLGYSAYEINRIFLTAIIKDPITWTPLFAETFKQALDFVKSVFNQTNYFAANDLKQQSYPAILIAQLDYLWSNRLEVTNDHIESREIKEEKQQERPEGMILLPQQIKTAKEWLGISCVMDDKQREIVCNQLYIKLDKILSSDMLALEIDGVTYNLPKDKVDRFIKNRIQEGVDILNKAKVNAEPLNNNNISDQNRAYISAMLIILSQANLALINPENFKRMCDHPQEAIWVARALKVLYKANLTLIDDEKFNQLYNNIQSILNISDVLNTLFKASPTFVNEKIFNLLYHHAEYTSIIAGALEDLCNANSTLINPENLKILDHHPKNAASIAIALTSLYRSNPTLVNDENRKLLGDHARYAIHIAHGLTILYDINPNFVNNENCKLLGDHEENASNIAGALGFLYKINPTLVNNENRKLLGDHAQNALDIANALGFLYKSNLTLINNENRKLLGDYAKYTFYISNNLNLLFRINPLLVDDKNFKLLCDYAQNNDGIYYALETLEKGNPSLIDGKNFKLLCEHAKNASDISVNLRLLFKVNPLLVDNKNIQLLCDHAQNASEILYALRDLEKIPSLFDDKNFKLLCDAQKARNIAEALVALYRTDTGLVNDENRKLLSDYVLHAPDIARILAILYKVNPMLVNDENRKILGDNVQNTKDILLALEYLKWLIPTLVNDKNYKLLCNHAEKARDIGKALEARNLGKACTLLGYQAQQAYNEEKNSTIERTSKEEFKAAAILSSSDNIPDDDIIRATYRQ